MKDKEILSKLQVIFQEIFPGDLVKIESSTSAKDISSWDSLNHINLVVNVEKAFDIKFALGEIADLQNVGDFVHLIQDKM